MRLATYILLVMPFVVGCSATQQDGTQMIMTVTDMERLHMAQSDGFDRVASEIENTEQRIKLQGIIRQSRNQMQRLATSLSSAILATTQVNPNQIVLMALNAYRNRGSAP